MIHFLVTKSDEIINVSHNNEVISNVVSALEFEHCDHTYNHHNDHCDEGTTWYDYLDTSSINIHYHYEPIVETEEIINEVKVLTLPNDITQKSNNTKPLYKLADLYQFQMYDLPRA